MENIQEIENQFHQHINYLLNHYENHNITYDNYFSRGTHLLFILQEMTSTCRIYFNGNFFLIFDYKTYNHKNTKLKECIFEKMSFLLENKKIYSYNSNEIILKSEISDIKIDEIKKLFITSLKWDIRLLNESNKAIEELIELVYFEFKEIIEQIWKTLHENFKLVEFKETIIQYDIEIPVKKSEIKHFKTMREYAINSANNYFRYKSAESKKKKNWAQKMYILGKKIGIFN